jgi:ABC-type transporter Mla subunit MlaD
LNKAAEIQEKAQKKAEELLQHPKDVHEESQLLLAAPKELIDEAKRRTADLSAMSKKVSKVVQQLSKAGNQAQRHKDELDQAAASADERLALLARHTARVGKLASVIRQLYGTMDKRIQQLRGRLDQANDLYRGVPEEIDKLRDALSAEVDQEFAAAPEQAFAAVVEPSSPQSAGQARRLTPQSAIVNPQSSKRAAPGPKPAVAPAPAPDDVDRQRSGSLGEIVQRNRKLNEWLREMLGDEETKALAERNATADRANRANQNVISKA